MKGAAAQSRTYQFGAYELDVRSGELLKEGRRLRLQEQPLQVLRLLLEGRGDVVTREEFRQKLWPGDTFVDFDHSLNNAINRLRDALADPAEHPRFIETLPRRGYRFLASVETVTPASSLPRVESIAVLPLEDLSGEPSEDYFAAGMTDALITSLAQIASLRVISRTSTLRFKGTHRSLPEIAQELRVDAVVEGTVVRSENRVRIDAQLILAVTDTHLWAGSYERDLREIIALQSELARAIADEIRVTLTPQEQAKLASARIIDPKAYEDYLRGRFYWNKRTAEGLKKSIEYYQRSIEKDFSYALAHAGLAECYNMMGYWGVLSPKEVYPLAKSEATAAVEIDESSAEAHAALAWTLFAYDWNWPEAKRELERAVRSNPGYVTARQWFSHYWIYLGMKAESLACVKKTLEVDPVSLVMNSNAAFMYFFARDFDTAIERARKTIEFESHFAPPYLCLGQAQEQKALFAEAIQAFETGLVHSERSPFMLAALGHVYAVSGKRAPALEIRKELEELSLQRYVSPFYFAVLSAGLGEGENSLRWLERALEDRSTWLAWLKVDPRFDALRQQPRFQAVLCKIGLSS